MDDKKGFHLIDALVTCALNDRAPMKESDEWQSCMATFCGVHTDEFKWCWEVTRDNTRYAYELINTVVFIVTNNDPEQDEDRYIECISTILNINIEHYYWLRGALNSR